MDHDNLYSNLCFLKKAIAYPNLSTAARHIGLSQPQLSRIVQRLEAELEIVLLDRSSKRKSGWTPLAVKLAEVATKASKQLATDIESSLSSYKIRHLKIGSLEGLTNVAIQVGKFLLDKKLPICEIDVHDLSDLEDLFLRGQYDLIFTFREPANRKFKFSYKLGYQTLEHFGDESACRVLSPFEFQSQTESERPTFVSNSLHLRAEWIQKYGGEGVVPSSLHPKPLDPKRDLPAWVFGSDTIPQTFWGDFVSYLRVLTKT